MEVAYIDDRGRPATEGGAPQLKWKCYAAAGVPLCLCEGATFAFQVSLKGQHLHFNRHTAATCRSAVMGQAAGECKHQQAQKQMEQ